jgi:hypothetical protein
MHTALRFFSTTARLLGLCGFFAALPAARAQFVELTSEAPVTLMLSTSTVEQVTTPTQRTYKTTISRVTQAQLLNQLLADNVIPDSTITGWSFVALRPLASELREVTSSFVLYLAKGTQRVRVPSGFFQTNNNTTTARYTEKHIGTYVLSSAGTINNHLDFVFNADVTVGSSTFVFDESSLDGFAQTAYATKDAADGFNIFFYAIRSTKCTALGGFSGVKNPGNTPTTGLLTLTLTVGPAKLVPESLYTQN